MNKKNLITTITMLSVRKQNLQIVDLAILKHKLQFSLSSRDVIYFSLSLKHAHRLRLTKDNK